MKAFLQPKLRSDTMQEPKIHILRKVNAEEYDDWGGYCQKSHGDPPATQAATAAECHEGGSGPWGLTGG